MQREAYYKNADIGDIKFPNVCMRRVSQGVRRQTPIPGSRAVVDKDTERTFAIVSSGYKEVRHEDVIAQMDEICHDFPEYGEPTREVWMTNYGGRMKTRWTFPNIDITIGNLSDGSPDLVHPTIETFCSYDTSLAHRTIVGGFRVVCTNGMVVGKILGEYRKKHTHSLSLDAARRVLANGLENYSEVQKLWLSYTQRDAYLPEVRAYEALGFQKEEQISLESKIKSIGNVIKWDDDDKENINVEINSWTLLNLYTEEATHRVKDLARQAKIQDNIANLFQ